jgi:hypothetical protein
MDRFDKLLGRDSGSRWRIILTSSAVSAATGIVLEGVIRMPFNVCQAVAITLGGIVFVLQIVAYINKSE